MVGETDFEAFWGRDFSCGLAEVNYQIGLEVSDLEAASAKAEALAAAAGAPPRNSMYDGPSYQDGRRGRYRQLNFLLPAKGADKVSKRLLRAGELLSYQLKRQPTDTKPIVERIAILEGELSGNHAALERLPMARLLLESRLTTLKAALASCKQADSKAYINLMLSDKPQK